MTRILLDDRDFDIRAVYICQWNVVFRHRLRHLRHLHIEMLGGVAVVVEVDILWVGVLQPSEREKSVIIAREVFLLDHFNVSFIAGKCSREPLFGWITFVV